MKELFNTLYAIDVNEYVEKKKTGQTELTYLSWPYAVKTLSEKVEDWSYEIEPYTYDENLGYMVHTSITIEGVTKKMWLPVMDGANKAMKDHPYKYQTKYGEKSVEPASMMDINKAQMRCLVKNIAMFGLGLYIYAGEDLPVESEDKVIDEPKDKVKPYNPTLDTGEILTDNQLNYLKRASADIQQQICNAYDVEKLEYLTKAMAINAIGILQNAKK